MEWDSPAVSSRLQRYEDDPLPTGLGVDAPESVDFCDLKGSRLGALRRFWDGPLRLREPASLSESYDVDSGLSI